MIGELLSVFIYLKEWFLICAFSISELGLLGFRKMCVFIIRYKF